MGDSAGCYNPPTPHNRRTLRGRRRSRAGPAPYAYAQPLPSTRTPTWVLPRTAWPGTAGVCVNLCVEDCAGGGTEGGGSSMVETSWSAQVV